MIKILISFTWMIVISLNTDDGRGLAPLHRVLQHLLQAQGRRRYGARRPAADHGRRRADRLREHRGPRRGRRARRRQGRGLRLEGHPRLHLLHRVRPLPEPVPGLEHREAAVPQAADHRAARPRLRQGAVPPGRRGRPRRPARAHVKLPRPSARWSAPPRATRSMPERRRGDRPRGAVDLHVLRRLRPAVPGRHRARRPHHGHAPLPGADRVELPRRAQRAVQGPGEQGQPLEHVAERAHGLGQGPRLRGQAGRRRTSRTSTRSTGCSGSAAPAPTRTAPRRPPARSPSCSTWPASPSPSSATARPAPATRPAAPATSSSSSSSRCRTPRCSRRPRSRRSSPPARTASTR